MGWSEAPLTAGQRFVFTDVEGSPSTGAGGSPCGLEHPGSSLRPLLFGPFSAIGDQWLEGPRHVDGGRQPRIAGVPDRDVEAVAVEKVNRTLKS